MEAKIEKISKLSKHLNAKNRMSDDLFHFLQVWHRSSIISPVIGDTGRSFRFGVNPSLCFFRIVVESIICDNDKEMSKALVMTEAFNPNQLLEHNVLKFFFLCCFLTSFIFLSSSCLSL